MSNLLNLDISDTLTCSTLRVTDASSYPVGYPIANPILEVTHPGADCPVIFTDIDQGFNKILNATNLHIMGSDSEQLVALPDGVYKFKYSINPNANMFVEFYWFRTCRIMSLYRKKVQDLIKKKCDLVRTDYVARMNDLLEVEFEIQAAKIMAEDRNDFKKASELYNSANTKLGKLSKDCLTC